MRKWLKDSRIWTGIGGLALGVVSIALVVSFWDSLDPNTPETVSRSETIRNLALIIGGLLAFVFALWRTLVAGRQADAARGQVETAQQSLFNERYQRGAEMLGGQVLAVRLGGIYALERLAAQQPQQYHLPIMKLFCAFVRNPPKDENLDKPLVIDGEEMRLLIREDTQAVLLAIGTRNSKQIRIEIEEKFSVDLHGANLAGGDMRQCNLDRADLTDANLTEADMSGKSSFARARLIRANLARAKLDDACFQDANCRQARFSDVKARRTSFRRADLEGTIWDHSNLEDARLSCCILKGASLLQAKLARAHFTGAVFGRGRRRMELPVDASVGDGIAISYTEVQTWITQAQLDQAKAADDCPPSIEPETTDFESGSQLVWNDGSVP